jgi:hypothetical protein
MLHEQILSTISNYCPHPADGALTDDGQYCAECARIADDVRSDVERLLDEREQRIREQIAAQIECVVVVARRDQGPAEAKAQAYATAAKIARGER